MSQIFLNLLTTKDITAPEMGRKIGEIIKEHAAELFPDRIGNWEPIKEPCLSPDDFASNWRWPVLAKRRKPRVSFSVWFRKPKRRYSSIFFDFSTAIIAPSKATELLAELARFTESEFGMIQEVSDLYRTRAEERNLLSFTDKAKKHFFIHLFDESLSNGIPDVFDIMWLPFNSWTVDSPNLIASTPGIFRLVDKDTDSRDEALKKIQRKG